jgi:hypothetical protein
VQVRRFLGEAHARLGAWCSQPEAAAWAAVQADGQDASVQQRAPTSAAFPLLSALLDVGLALDRSPRAERARTSLTVAVGQLSAKGRNRLALRINQLRAAATGAGPPSKPAQRQAKAQARAKRKVRSCPSCAQARGLCRRSPLDDIHWCAESGQGCSTAAAGPGGQGRREAEAQGAGQPGA